MALPGHIWVEGDEVHYIDSSGVERVCVNVEVDNADRAEITSWLK